MKVVEINTSNYGSTGQIMLGVAERLRAHGHEVMVCYPATRLNRRKKIDGAYLICGHIVRNVIMRFSQLFGCDDLLFRFVTRRLTRKIDCFGADLVHLHNLHGWYINLPILFGYLREKKIPIVWTLHDCWALTGHCPYFDRAECHKWKSDCLGCPQYREYPQCHVDNAARMLRVKRQSLTGLAGLSLVTPSAWLASLAHQSYLKYCPVRIIHNGIDATIFRPITSEFRAIWHLERKTVLLGVAMGWDARKGLDVFIRLASELDDRFVIVLVGTNDKIDAMLPNCVISIHRTMNQQELAEIYSSADIFINPTREENFPTVNLEAIACGTPVLTFNTGGSPETIDATCGSVVEKDDYEAFKSEIIRITEEKPYSPESCRARALQLTNAKMQEAYVRLFEELVGKQKGS